jgi:hypothetical protein
VPSRRLYDVSNEKPSRKSVLPPDLHKCKANTFWRDPARNPNNVRVV